MPVTQPRELFLRELADVLAAERMLVGLLPELREQANDPRLREGLERHRHETDGHVKNVEQAFHRLGEEPTNDRCPAMEGLAREHKETLREVTAELHDQAVVIAAAAAEHYEIATYESLITMAEPMGERDVVQLLRENLAEEEAMLHECAEMAKRLAESGAARQAELDRSLVDRLLPGR